MSATTNKRLLAVDYGERRVGLAKTDADGMIATALETLSVKSDQQAIEKLGRVIKDIMPAALVIGYPLNEDGTTNESCEKVDRFIDRLTRIFDGPIHKVDEYGSSEEAAAVIHAHGKPAGKKKPRIDRLAAAIILQRFLDERSGQDRVQE